MSVNSETNLLVRAIDQATNILQSIGQNVNELSKTFENLKQNVSEATKETDKNIKGIS